MPYLLFKANLRRAHSIKNYMFKNRHNNSIPDKPKILAFAFSNSFKKGVKDSNRGRGALSELRGTALELDRIQLEYDHVENKLYWGLQGNKDIFLQECEKDFDIIHLGLLAGSDPEKKLNNKIYFRGNKKIITGSSLRIRDVYKKHQCFSCSSFRL